MKRSDAAHRLHIDLDARRCRIPAGEIGAMEAALEPLAAAVERYPVCDLAITVAYFERSGEYHVRTVLTLPAVTLLTGEHDGVPLPAFERCVRKLVRKVARLPRGAGVAVRPNFAGLPEPRPVAGDYAAFRRETAGAEAAVRVRFERWLERRPALAGIVDGDRLADAVIDEVFLNAFERRDSRPAVLGVGDWLEGLVAPSARSLLRHPEEESEAAGFARTLRELADDGRFPGGSAALAALESRKPR